MLIDGISYVAGSDHNYDIAGSTINKPIDAAVLMRFIATRAFRLPTGLTGSQCESTVAPAAGVAYSIKKNGSPAGTIDFAISALTATFTFASDVDFAAGDVLTVEAPATADTTHDELAWTFKTAAV